MIKVVNKGYTIKVVSWENDGDNYNTKTITVDTKEEAKAYYNLMKICRSKNQHKNCVGNTYDGFSEKDEKIIIRCLKENPLVLKGEDIEHVEDYQLIDWFSDVCYNLMGGSEYSCRVMESCTVTYSPEDIYLEEIKF